MLFRTQYRTRLKHFLRNSSFTYPFLGLDARYCSYFHFYLGWEVGNFGGEAEHVAEEVDVVVLLAGHFGDLALHFGFDAVVEGLVG